MAVAVVVLVRPDLSFRPDTIVPCVCRFDLALRTAAAAAAAAAAALLPYAANESLAALGFQQHQMIIASDAIPYVDGKAHPRGAGCFCRVLREFVPSSG